MTDGWEAHECISPDDLRAAYDPQARQVFIADDAFGSTEYRPDAAERWARELERLLARPRRSPLADLDLPPGAAARRRCTGSTRSAAPSASRRRREVQVDASDPRRRGEGADPVPPRQGRRTARQRPGARCGCSGPRSSPPRTSPRAHPPARRSGWAARDVQRGARRRLGADDTDRGHGERPSARWAPSTATCWWRCSTHRPGPCPSASSSRRCAATTRDPLSQAPPELVDRLADHFLRVSA